MWYYDRRVGDLPCYEDQFAYIFVPGNVTFFSFTLLILFVNIQKVFHRQWKGKFPLKTNLKPKKMFEFISNRYPVELLGTSRLGHTFFFKNGQFPASLFQSFSTVNMDGVIEIYVETDVQNLDAINMRDLPIC